jgi:hypothetical protein
MHRLVIADHKKDTFITRGDCGLENDPPVPGAQILGFAAAKEVKVAGRVFTVTLDGRASRGRRMLGCAMEFAARLNRRAIAARMREAMAVSVSPTRNRILLPLAAMLLSLLVLPHSHAQVAVDASTSGAGQLTGIGTKTLTFNHTTANVANRLLIVGVSLNITNAPTSALVGITYNGTPMNFIPDLGQHSCSLDVRCGRWCNHVHGRRSNCADRRFRVGQWRGPNELST